MNVLEQLQARIDDLVKKGKEAVKTGNISRSDEIKAELETVKAELRAEISYMDDEELRGLKAQAKAMKLEDGDNIDKIEGKMNFNKKSQNSINEVNALDTAEYKNAVLDDLMGKATPKQLSYIGEVNASTHTTGTTATIIPNSIVGAIWTQIEELYPMWADIPRTQIRGDVTYDKNIGHDDDGGWLLEGDATPSVKFNFGQLTLRQKEFSRSVDLTFRLEAASRADFENHLVQQLALVVGKALAVAIYRGTGGELMPRGIRTALLADDPSQVFDTAEAGYPHLTYLFSRLKSGLLAGAVLYANNQTIWQVLASMTDENGRPILMMTVANGRVGTIFGVPVRESAEMADGEVLLANHVQGYRCNVNMTGTGIERDNRNRIIAHFMHVIADGDVLNTKSYALMRHTTPLLAPVDFEELMKKQKAIKK